MTSNVFIFFDIIFMNFKKDLYYKIKNVKFRLF